MRALLNEIQGKMSVLVTTLIIKDRCTVRVPSLEKGSHAAEHIGDSK